MKAQVFSNQHSHIPAVWKDLYWNQQDPKAFFAQQLDQAIENRLQFRHRDVLSAALETQYKGFQGIVPAKAIALLKEKNTFTITTGHQLGLFGGPLFFWYKIASAIHIARDMKVKHPDKNFVPVYWMASEDHDFAEINHVNLFGTKLTWESAQKGAVGKFITDGILPLIEELNNKKGDLPHAEELIEIFRTAYKQENLTAATRYLVHALFEEENLICLDGDDVALKQLFVPVMLEEITSQESAGIVSKKSDELIAKGYHAQVHPRAVNLFYLSGPGRFRIVQDEGGAFVTDQYEKVWDKDSIVKEMQEYPERFSPNVVMRPLYQETILPNLAYIGGPGEIAYWMQLVNLFPHYKVPLPVLMPRTSMIMIDAPTEKRMEKLNFSVEDIFRDAYDLEKDFLMQHAGDEISLEEFKKSGETFFSQLLEKVLQADPGLNAQVMAEQKKLYNFLENLEVKLRRSEKQKHEQSIKQIHALKEKLFPQNNPQERFDCIIPYYWRYGKSLLNFFIENAAADTLDYKVLFTDRS